MSIASDLMRGNTDMIILAHLARGESYGYEINKQIAQKSQGRLELKEATLYGAFRRLEEGGHITFYWGDERTGARRRYYRITPSGQDFFAQTKRDWEEARDIIDALITPETETGGNSESREEKPDE